MREEGDARLIENSKLRVRGLGKMRRDGVLEGDGGCWYGRCC